VAIKLGIAPDGGTEHTRGNSDTGPGLYAASGTGWGRHLFAGAKAGASLKGASRCAFRCVCPLARFLPLPRVAVTVMIAGAAWASVAAISACSSARAHHHASPSPFPAKSKAATGAGWLPLSWFWSGLASPSNVTLHGRKLHLPVLFTLTVLLFFSI
jgi:hypothetical protein